MQHVVSEENHNTNSMVGLWVETGTSALRLYNSTKFTVAFVVKSHSKACSACTLVLIVNNYRENFLLNSSYSYELRSVLKSRSFLMIA